MKKMDILPVGQQVIKTGTTFARWAFRAVRFIVITFLVAVFYYVVFALVYDTDQESMLKRENEVLNRQYSEMAGQINLLDDVVEGITARDEAIYAALFNSSIPDHLVNPVTASSLDFGRMSSQNEADFVEQTFAAVSRSDAVALQVSSSLDSLVEAFAADPQSIRSIPSIAPVADFSIGQSGASTGIKFNPFFKTPRFHRGFDIMASSGTGVVAPADGIVTLVRMNDKSDGKVVEITHANGMVTAYRHLGRIMVSRGQIVKRGSVIASVGMSGRSFAPHLHYEVISNGEYLDPVHFFFASASDGISYEKMLMMASNTGQSMD